MPRTFNYDKFVSEVRTKGISFPDRTLVGGKLRAVCETHGDFYMVPGNLRRGSTCPKCAADNRCGETNPRQQRAAAAAIARFRQAHGDRYDYSLVEYVGAHRLVKIICSVHGVFEQSPTSHRNGHGCNACADLVRAAKRMEIGINTIEDRVTEAHAGKFVLEEAPRTMHGRMKVWCTEHERSFTAKSTSAETMKGCPSCVSAARVKERLAGEGPAKAAAKKKAMKWERFAALAEKVHGAKYDYSGAVYVGSQAPMQIRCIACDDVFYQSYDSHITKGSGCPKCSHHKSGGEDEVLRFVRIFDPEVGSRIRGLIGKLEIDVYSDTHKLGVEYCGLYWHSTSSVEEERKDKLKHWIKHNACLREGIELVTLYDEEWLNRKAAVKRLLRAKLGKMRGKVYARECVFEKVESKEARKFFEKYHVQGGNGEGLHYGLFYKEKLVACMRFAHGNNDRGAAERVWTLARYASRVQVVGGASRLMSKFVAEVRPSEIKSFSDNRFFSGGLYEQLGFTLVSDSQPEYMVWSPKLGLLPKSKFQRSELPQRQLDLGQEVDFDPETDKRTETEMTYAMKCARVFDCGKKKWIWTNPSR
jgi:predicted  nucleic acid-binding Zn-ribbon protein